MVTALTALGNLKSWSTLLTVGATLLQVASARGSARYQASVARAQAETTRRETVRENEQLRAQIDSQRSRNLALIGKSGAAFSGSPLFVTSYDALTSQLDLLRRQKRGMHQSSIYETQAKQQRISGNYRIASALVDATNTIVKAQ
ncbi:MAG: hypothetical protein N0E48_16060 [Candidatus Thiodiazotropha endolucinida]|nr:hypothetical protein [Candidatus Thiodiazotropha taylori]MCW4344846.1 hypothetical protein [Candidatus Thiodiazotropha endolucinida]